MAKAATKLKPAPAPEADGAPTWAAIRAGAELYWPGIGGQIVDQMTNWNDELFEGIVRPMPVVLSRMSATHGHWFVTLGRECDQRRGFEQGPTFQNAFGYIPPKQLLQVRKAEVLRGMMFVYLDAKGLDSRPGKQPWNELAMRLHRVLTGDDIWMAEKREFYRDYIDPNSLPESSMSIRQLTVEQAFDPKTGAASLSDQKVKNWPIGTVDLGDFIRDVKSA